MKACTGVVEGAALVYVWHNSFFVAAAQNPGVRASLKQRERGGKGLGDVSKRRETKAERERA